MADARNMSTIRARFLLQKGNFTLDADFEVPARGVTALFGPSGAGKTTLLRCIAGLEHPSRGFFEINGHCWQDDTQNLFLPSHQRPIGYVFQEGGLFPHLSAEGNLEFALRRNRGRRGITFQQAVEWLGIASHLDRFPSQLSGGERQRVAVARALLSAPELLLMDEPLASLDSAGKSEIFPCLERLHAEMAIPILYVSHALDEVARVADHLVALEKGKTIAQGPLLELVTRLDLPLSRLDSSGAVIEATVAEHDDAFHLTYLTFPGGRISVARQNLESGRKIRLRIPARDVSVTLEEPKRSSILNIFEGRVIEIAEDGPSQVMLKLEVGGVYLLARITRKSLHLLGLKPDAKVHVQVKSVALIGGG